MRLKRVRRCDKLPRLLPLGHPPAWGPSALPWGGTQRPGSDPPGLAAWGFLVQILGTCQAWVQTPPPALAPPCDLGHARLLLPPLCNAGREGSGQGDVKQPRRTRSTA